MFVLNEIFQQVILYASSSSGIKEFCLSHILGENHERISIPTNCDFTDSDTIGKIVNAIIGNFIIVRQYFDFETWQFIFFTLISCIQEVENYHLQLAKLSLFVTISRFDRDSFLFMMNLMGSIQIQEMPYSLGTNVLMILNCPSVMERFQSFFHSSSYQYPPRIFIANCIPANLQGWIGFNNILIINQELIPVKNSMTDVMTLASTILYLSKHADLQDVQNNFNSFIPPSESGWLLEQALWGGCRLCWCDPTNPQETERYAQAVWKRLAQLGALNLTTQDRLDLKTHVGRRPEQLGGGLDWYQPFEVAE